MESKDGFQWTNSRRSRRCFHREHDISAVAGVMPKAFQQGKLCLLKSMGRSTDLIIAFLLSLLVVELVQKATTCFPKSLDLRQLHQLVLIAPACSLWTNMGMIAVRYIYIYICATKDGPLHMFKAAWVSELVNNSKYNIFSYIKYTYYNSTYYVYRYIIFFIYTI